MASISFRGVTKRWGAFFGVKALDLEVADQEFLVLLGPSGCGKTTTMRMVAGLEDPTDGEILIGDDVVNDVSPRERDVAMVFQDYALYPHMTVRRNLEFPLKMRDLPRAEIERQMQWAAELLGLGELLDRLPRQLSGGQRQRVAMGRALVRQPTVFLMDEPLSNLDARLRVQIRAELSDLLERLSATTIYVTHDQAEAMTLGDRVAVLDHGHLQQVAPPQELYEQPANTFVAGFIGNPPMNLFPARLVADAGGLRLRVGDQSAPLASAAAATASWRDCLEQPLTAGLRPEHVSLAAEAEAGWRATVHDAEYLGHETLLYLRLAGVADPNPILVARLPGIRPFHKGDVMKLRLNCERLHLFGPDGERK